MGRKPKNMHLEMKANDLLIWLYGEAIKGAKIDHNLVLLAREANVTLNFSKAKLATQVIKQDTTIKEELDLSEIMKALGDEEKPIGLAVKNDSEPESSSEFET